MDTEFASFPRKKENLETHYSISIVVENELAVYKALIIRCPDPELVDLHGAQFTVFHKNIVDGHHLKLSYLDDSDSK